MRKEIIWKVRAGVAMFSAGAIMLLWSATSFAGTPRLESDCGAGATIVGSDAAGKITLGVGVKTCTLTFSVTWPNEPACIAVNETNGGGRASTVGMWTTKTHGVIDGTAPLSDGDVVSYQCIGY